MANSDNASKEKWSEGLKAEFKKIIWPNKKDITKQTVAVVVCSFFLGLIIALLDFVIQHGVDFLVNIKF